MWTHVPAQNVEVGTKFLSGPGEEAEVFEIGPAYGDVKIPHTDSKTEDILVFKYHPVGSRVRKDTTRSYLVDKSQLVAIWVD